MSESVEQPWPDRNMLDAAMGIISNVSGGNWWGQSQEWQDAARQWLDSYAKLGKLEATRDKPTASAVH
jgi:hypothetical protein